MRKLNISLYILVLLEIIALICYYVFGWKSDQAMDKSGIGDAEMCLYWSRLAGYSFWSLISAWFISVVVSLVTKSTLFNKNSKYYKADVKLNKLIKTATFGPVIALPASWLLYFGFLTQNGAREVEPVDSSCSDRGCR